MKKIVYIAFLVFAFISCEPDSIKDPELIFSEETLVFNESEMKSLFITTKPKTDCDFQITSKPSWLNVNKTSGRIYEDYGIDEIKITSNFTNYKPGKYEGKLDFTTTLGNKSILVTGFVGENSLYSLPEALNFTMFNNSLKFTIKNEGNIDLNYSIENSNNKLTLSQNSGDIVVNSEKEITVNLNRNNLPNGITTSNLNITINNKLVTIAVSIDNFNEQKMSVNGDVIDAEYSKTKNKLVFVTSNPSKVCVFSSGAESIESISLSYVPTCVSLSSDGETAVVGHDGHISYINLQTNTIIDSYPVSCDAIDIVLANNKWAYVFPRENQWESIRCINMNLSNNNEILGNGYQIYAGTKGRLHPSGKYIYGADNGLSPSDIEKYNIQNGAAVNLYDSPYHGDYPMSGNLWFSEDGNRIFTRGKTVLKVSEIQTQDMVYNGKINSESFTNIEWLDHSNIKSNLYVIGSSGYSWISPNRLPYIYIYNSTNLSYKSKLDLEKFLVPDNIGGGSFYDAIPHFVFSNSSGNSLFVMTKADGSGLANEWAIQKVTIE